MKGHAEVIHPVRGGLALMDDRPGPKGPAWVRGRSGTPEPCPWLCHCSVSTNQECSEEGEDSGGQVADLVPLPPGPVAGEGGLLLWEGGEY